MSHTPSIPVIDYRASLAGPAPSYNRILHYLAIATTLATFPLIFMGGLVTTKGAGLAVPDWPNSYGYNMFLFPPSKWVSGIFYEHTHRLLGTLVGFFAVLLVLWAWGPSANRGWRNTLLVATIVLGIGSVGVGGWLIFHPADTEAKLLSRSSQLATAMCGGAMVTLAAWFCRSPEPRRWVRWLSLGVLAAVIAQGVLGGLRVTLLKLDLAIVHACVAQAFLCIAGLMAVVTSGWWLAPLAVDPANRPAGRGLVRLAIVAWVVIFLQLGLGATMRHYRAGLAIPDLPLAFGQAIPPTSQDEFETTKAAYARTLATDEEVYALDDVSLTQVWLAFSHRVGAVAVTIVLALLCTIALVKHRGLGLAGIAGALLVLLLAQLTLGVIVVLFKKPADITSYHVAVGALILLMTFVLIVRAMRLYWPTADARSIAGHPTTPSSVPTYNVSHSAPTALTQG